MRGKFRRDQGMTSLIQLGLIQMKEEHHILALNSL
jgi:hypothetical protein